MTTTVTILVSGNKACEIVKDGSGLPASEVPQVVKPGQFAIVHIHGDQSITVRETGEFL